jgi:predicted nucleic acid-binding protein
MRLRDRAWSLRANLSPADALFAALAAELGERLVTKDAALAAAASRFAGVEVQHLRDPSP